jgi:hypothetical protein
VPKQLHRLHAYVLLLDVCDRIAFDQEEAKATTAMATTITVQ